MSASDVASNGIETLVNGNHITALADSTGSERTPNGTPKPDTKSKGETNSASESDLPGLDIPSRRLLLDHYGVEARSEQPRKKVKTVHNNDDSERQAKGSFQHKGSGVIGEYMKQKTGTDDGPPTANSVVDLTNDDDDEIQFMGARSADDKIVCFGRLFLCFNAYLCPKTKKKAQYISDQQWPHMSCTLFRKPENKSNLVIGVSDEFEKEFAHVASDEAGPLAKAMDGLAEFQMRQALVLPRPKRNNEWPHTEVSYTVKAQANVYGRRGDVERVGKLFGQANMWFKTPTMPDKDVPYVNPHIQKRTTTQVKVAGPVTPRPVLDEWRSNEEVAQHMASMIDEWSKKQARKLPETDAPASIKTALLAHQKQALTFMLNREKPRTYDDADDSLTLSLWRKKTSTKGIVYEDIVSGMRTIEEPSQVFGGLLADVMGLGKTLEALSLVATTAEEAEAFGAELPNRRNPEDTHIKAHTKSTLIVCPTSTVQNWETQIREHLDNDQMTHYIYHGQNRTTNAFDLKKFDVVVTTYGTVASDFRGFAQASPLRQLKWFRVILDEAHTIREPKAQQSQACYGLSAQRRWALTGTPIQNRISDLGSLTRFLRLSPYDDAGHFNHHIGSKAVASDESYLDKLRLFVDSFCLRRDSTTIVLPKRSDMVTKLKFSDSERRMHDHFKEKAMIQIEELIQSKNKKSGVHLHMLKGITTLRLICAHGRDLLKEADLKELQGTTAAEPIDLDEEQGLRTINKRQAYENFNLMAEAGADFCMQCDSRVTGESPQTSGVDDSGARAYILPCLDMLCAECFSLHKEMFDSTEDKYAIECPFCGLDVAAQYVAIEASVTDDNLPDDTVNGAEGGRFSKYKGPQTKVKALLGDIARMKEKSKPLEEEGERPLKCVVFSEFTSNLTLIEKALTSRGYTFARIDGSMSLNARRKVLDALDNDDSLTILLASIKAAGQGLNLTAASYAFIMEPMWNPAAEAQAVDRIYRIGQSREVFIRRYQIEDSIEMKIVELARKKTVLAQVSMNSSDHKKLSKSEQRAQNLKDIVSLFK